MKWPSYLVLVRHGESAFNQLQKQRDKHPLWKEFIKEFDNDFTSQRSKALAEKIMKLFPLRYSDYETPLTNLGREQARQAGVFLKTQIPLPDVVITSPYLRCRDTFKEMANAWPELKNVQYYTEEYIQERNIGQAILYTNWRLFYTFHPEQKRLYDLQKYYHYKYPEGEDVPAVRIKSRLWFGTLTREFSNQCVLAITHHITLLSIRASLERMTPEEFMELDKANPPRNCSVTIYRGCPELGSDGKLVLEAYNTLPPKSA